jgi:hypothetical protein
MLNTKKVYQTICAYPTQEPVLECNLPRLNRPACHGLLAAVNAYQSRDWSLLTAFRYRQTQELHLIAYSQRSVAHANELTP